MQPSDREIDALLARGGLAGPESDRILDEVLARRARRPWWRLGLTLGAGLGLLATAAAGLVIGLRPGSSGFTPRGAAISGPAVEVVCLGGSLAACPAGATLLFAVRGGSSDGYLAAWAEPARPGGERVWYFSADQESPRLVASAQAAQALSRGVRIGPEHAPGLYRLHVVLSASPLFKAALANGVPAGVLAHEELTLTVTEPAP
jgi:hypothetical protein